MGFDLMQRIRTCTSCGAKFQEQFPHYVIINADQPREAWVKAEKCSEYCRDEAIRLLYHSDEEWSTVNRKDTAEQANKGERCISFSA